MMTTARRLLAAASTVVGVLVILAGPAAATPVPYALEADRGRLEIGGFLLAADVPSTLGSCPVDIDLSGTIDTTATSDNLDATLAVSAPFVVPLFAAEYILRIDGTSTGADRGDLDPLTGSFAGLTFPGATFSIARLDTTTCAVGATVCAGTLTVTLDGAFTLPPSTATAHASSSAGQVTSRAACSFPFSAFLSVGTAVDVGRHPAFPADPGMLFS